MKIRHILAVAATISIGCGEPSPAPVAQPGNPCMVNNGGCAPTAICEHIDDTAVCACKPGYSGDGFTCAEDNPCAVNNGGCDPNATCEHVDGAPVCTCKPGYVGDGLTCTEGQAPILVISSPAEGATFSLAQPATIEVAGTVEDADLEEFAYRIDESEPTKIAVDGQAFSFAFDVADEDYSSRVITVVARDRSGHSSEAKRTIGIDRLAPRVEVSSPADGVIISEETLEIEGTIADADLQRATMRLDDGPSIDLELVDGTMFRATLPMPEEDEVSHRLTILAADGLGNETSLGVSFVVDRVGPIVSVTGLADQQVIGSNSPNPYVVTGRVENATAASYSIDGSPAASLESGDFAIAISLNEADDHVEHVLTIDASDSRGNLASKSIRYIVDRAAPRISLQNLVDGQVVAGDSPSPLAVSGQIVDGHIVSASYQIDSQSPVGITNPSFVIGIPLNEADDQQQHVLAVEALDAGGNTTRESWTFVVDRAAPRLTIVNLSEGQLIGGGAPNPFVLMGQVVDSALASATYRLDSGAPIAFTPTAAFQIEIPLDEADDHASHTIAIEISDSAGNIARETINYVVDRAAPTIAILGLSEGQIFGSSAVSPHGVPVQITEALLSTATYRIDSSPAVTISGSSVTVNIPFSDTDDHQQHILVIEATDSAGNVARESRTFFVDRVAPRISVDNLLDQQLLGRMAANPFVVTGRFDDGSLYTPRYHLDNSGPISLETAAAFSVNIPLAETDDFVAHTLVLEAIDSASNSTRETIHFVVDRVAPRVTISSPAQDGSCEPTATTCSGAVINLATGPSFRFEGTADDPGLDTTGGIAATIGSIPIAPSGTTNWAFDWSSLPNDDGASYTFTITATDRAGNSTAVNRDVWVDRVAPFLQSSVNNSRLVARNASLVTFSEQMDVASFKAATTFNPSANPTNLTTIDRQSFAFSSVNALSPYTVYSMHISPGAHDRARNQLATAGSVLFLTEPVDPNLSSPTIATSVADPVLRTDTDGRPVLLYRPLSGTSIVSKFWLGTSDNNYVGWESTSLTAPTGALGIVAGDLVVSGGPQTNLQLAPIYEAVVAVETTTGRTVHHAERQLSSNWALSSSLGLASSVGFPSLASGLFNGTKKEFVAFLSPDSRKVMGRIRSGTSWLSSQTLFDLNLPAIAMNQTGLLDNDTVAYIPERGSFSGTIDPSNGGVAVAGVQQVEVNGSPAGSAYLAYSATATNNFLGNSYTKPYLVLACSQDPASPTAWQQASNTPPILPLTCGATCSSNKRITGLSMAASDTKVAIAVEVDGNTVIFGSMDNGSCSSAPSNVIWEPAITSAKQPAVAVGRNGKVYKVYVAETSDTLRWAP